MDISNIQKIDDLFWEKYIYLESCYTNMFEYTAKKYNIPIEDVKPKVLDVLIYGRTKYSKIKDCNREIKELLNEYLDIIKVNFIEISKYYNYKDAYAYECERFGYKIKSKECNLINKVIFVEPKLRRETTLLSSNIRHSTYIDCFNFNKNEILSLEIEIDSKIQKIKIDNFEEQFGDFKYSYMKSELKSIEEFYNENNTDTDYIKDIFNDCRIKSALRLIAPYYKLRGIPNIKFEKEIISLDKDNKEPSGQYNREILILDNIDIEDTIETIIHEIGHFIHHRIFNEEVFNFPFENKPSYANKNHKEDFACCFSQLVYRREINSRTRMMFNILRNAI